MRSFLDDWFMEHDILFTPEYMVKSTGLMLPLIKEHLGISIIPAHFAAEGTKNGSLIRIITEKAPPPRAVCLATNPSHPVSAISREFISFILDNSH